jgi:Fe-S cluster assembly iron-binding protein IscA
VIGVTERAKEELKVILTDRVGDSEACLRLKANEEGKLGLGIDVEKPDDKSIEYEGVKLLVVEPELADRLENVAIDVVDTDEGKQFVIMKMPE